VYTLLYIMDMGANEEAREVLDVLWKVPCRTVLHAAFVLVHYVHRLASREC
jgi:hypothetical protein